MNAYLLYEDRDWVNVEPYGDASSIMQDLGLKTLFDAASREVVREEGRVKSIKQADPYLAETMRRVMMVPLQSREEIEYRQEILQDCLTREAFTCELYDVATRMMAQWDKLGRRTADKTGSRSPSAILMEDIQLIRLFADTLSSVKKLFEEHRERFSSRGLLSFYERLCEEFSEEVEQSLYQILEDVSFYVGGDEEEKGQNRVRRPKIVLECGIGEGLKFSSVRLEQVTAEAKKFYNPNGAIAKLQEYRNKFVPDSVQLQKNTELRDQAYKLEYQVVRYVVSCCNPFVASFGPFFEQLRLQAAFYRGAVNLKQHMLRFGLGWCLPVTGDRKDLRFRELKELVMCMEQRVNAVGNTCGIDDRLLLIVTGANQGGKSTFLRSIGVAQVLMQSGLMVAAESYESGIFPRLFTHFTRREDSAMNSGRLDDELRRMNQIVEQIAERGGDGSLVLLNESFATTTEKEGSVIAYDIIRALTEAGVKVLTVTHLLSFAQRVYDENGNRSGTEVEFLCAERLENGTRTFRMIQHAPEMTSFGLDLYDEIVGKRKGG